MTRKTDSYHKQAEFSLTPVQIIELFDAAGNIFARDRLVIELLYSCALRRSEVAGLRVKDLHISQLRITVSGKGKPGRKRKLIGLVPVPRGLMERLSQFVEWTGKKHAEPLFLSRLGKQLSGDAIADIVEKAGKAAGLKHPNPERAAADRPINAHLLRHSFAKHWLKAGGDMVTLSKIMRHSSIKVTIDEYGPQGIDDTQERFDKTYPLMVTRPAD